MDNELTLQKLVEVTGAEEDILKEFAAFAIFPSTSEEATPFLWDRFFEAIMVSESAQSIMERLIDNNLCVACDGTYKLNDEVREVLLNLLSKAEFEKHISDIKKLFEIARVDTDYGLSQPEAERFICMHMFITKLQMIERDLLTFANYDNFAKVRMAHTTLTEMLSHLPIEISGTIGSKFIEIFGDPRDLN